MRLGEDFLRDSIRLSFSGYLTLREQDLGEREHLVVAHLQEESENIAREIAERLGDAVGATPNVAIDFAEGSIEWFGWVEWARATWPSIEVLSSVGGAIGLIQFVKSAVDGVLRRWFRRAVGPRPLVPYPSSRVVFVAVPASAVRHQSAAPIQRMLGISALVASASLFVAAVALLIHALR